MKRLLAFGLLVVAGGALWWWREPVSRFAVAHVPALAPYLGVAPATVAAQTPRQAPPAIPVVVAQADRRSVPITVDAVGTVQPIASIAIKPRVDSQISAIAVKEGALVKAGDLLFRLDDRGIRAQLAQADATIEKDQAQVEQSRRDLARAEELVAKKYGTEVGRDAAATTLKVQQAQLAADVANRDYLATLLSYTEIRAPVSGRIGTIALKLGTTVRLQDSQAIATLNQIDPIYVSFAVPQSLFGDLRAAMSASKVAIVAKVGGQAVPGTVEFVENTVDLATGTVLARAEMSNADERLWPGAFVAVQATLGIQENAVAVPSSAIQIGQQGAYLFVVKEDRRAALTPVTVARTQGSETVIAQGLSGGEQVVVDGQLRLVDGATVQVQPAPRSGVATGDPGPTAQRRS